MKSIINIGLLIVVLTACGDDSSEDPFCCDVPDANSSEDAGQPDSGVTDDGGPGPVGGGDGGGNAPDVGDSGPVGGDPSDGGEPDSGLAGGPDLITVEASLTFSPDENLVGSVNYEIQNVGTGATDSTEFSNELLLVDSEGVPQFSLIRDIIRSDLSPNQSLVRLVDVDFSKDIDDNPITPGVYTASFLADSRDDLLEANEDNNTFLLDVYSIGDLPDLAIIEANLNLNEPVNGIGALTYRLQNIGNAGIPNRGWVDILALVSVAPDSDEVFFAAFAINEFALPAGETHVVDQANAIDYDLTFDIVDNIPVPIGEYFIVLITDAGDDYDELNEENNGAVLGSISLEPPEGESGLSTLARPRIESKIKDILATPEARLPNKLPPHALPVMRIRISDELGHPTVEVLD